MIVVTGGAGFIGSNLVRGLNAQGFDEIVVVDDLSDASKHLNLQDCRFVDYIDKDQLLGEFKNLGKIKAVFHQGGCAVTTEQNGRLMMETNFTYSKHLLHACLGGRIPFIYASSAAVYGTGHQPFREEPELERPLNVYGFSKLVFDRYVRNILYKCESPVTGLRYFNVYGPGEEHKGNMASVILNMWKQFQKGETLKLFKGSENFMRDFVYVDDIVKINLHFLRSSRSGVFNCGTGETQSFLQLAEFVSAELDGAKIERIEMPSLIARQYQSYTCSDNSRLVETGYKQCFTKLGDGIRSYISILENRSGSG